MTCFSKKHTTMFALVMVFLLGAATPLSASANRLVQSPTPPVPERASQLVDLNLLHQLQEGVKTDFVVEMTEQADLHQALQFSDWKGRGDYVYRQLVETAGRTQKEAVSYLAAHGIQYRAFLAGNQVYVYSGDLSTASYLAALPAVRRIRTPLAGVVAMSPLAPLGPQQPAAAVDWGLVDTHATDFWSTFNRKGEGILVAGIDTGVQWDHPALLGQFKCGSSPADPACWYDPTGACGSSGACDEVGHGTAVMGVAVAKDDQALPYVAGMAPNAQWIACKACTMSGCTEDALNACADWILAPDGDPANRPDVVTNGWGGAGGDAWFASKVQVWRAAGIFPLFTMGGGGPSCSTVGSPADYQDSFATAAYDSSRQVAPFSPRGPSSFGSSPYTKPNLSAPGVNIFTTVPNDGWQQYSGTSFAMSYSAGAVALLWSCSPELRGEVDATFQLLQSSADAPPASSVCGTPPNGGTYSLGYGFLNVLAAGQQVCQTGILQGTVKNINSEPIVGASITVVSTAPPFNQHSMSSDSQGHYLFNLAEGQYAVTAVYYGQVPQHVGAVAVAAGQTTTQDFNLMPAPDMLLSGMVTGEGIPLDGFLTITSPGFYENLPTDPNHTGSYYGLLFQETEYAITVTARLPGYHPDTLTGLIFSGDTTRNFDLSALFSTWLPVLTR